MSHESVQRWLPDIAMMQTNPTLFYNVLPNVISSLAKEIYGSYNARTCSWLFSALSPYNSQLWIHFRNLQEFRYAPNFDAFLQEFSECIHQCCRLTIDARGIRQLQCLYVAGLLEVRLSDGSAIDVDLWNFAIGIGYFLLSSLSAGFLDLHALIIGIIERWWDGLINSFTKIDVLFSVAVQLCSAVLLHWNSDDPIVMKAVRKFMSTVMYHYDCGEQLRSWLLDHLINETILCGPTAQHGCVVLSKGAIHCLPALIESIGSVEMYTRSPYLTTSLMLSLGHNYTAATAGDVIARLLSSFCQAEALESHNAVLFRCLTEPIIQYVLFDQLDCTVTQESVGSSETAVDVIRLNRRVNFAQHCLRKEFLAVRLTQLGADQSIIAHCSPFFHSGISLLDLLFRALGACLQSELTPFAMKQHQLFMWLHLFALHNDKVSLLNNESNLSPFLVGLHHSDDQLRAVALTGLSNLACQVLNHLDRLRLPSKMDRNCPLADPSQYIDLFLSGIALLCGSTVPAARKRSVSTFADLIRAVRNACTSVDSSVLEDLNHLLPKPSSSSSLCESRLQHWATAPADQHSQIVSDRTTLALFWLAKLVDFNAQLWGTTSTESSVYCRLAFWPGMTYQRAYVTLELMFTSVGLLNLRENGADTMKQWRTSYTTSSIRNLQMLVEKLSSMYKWSYCAPGTLYHLLCSLTLLNVDLQAQLLKMVNHNWPDVVAVLSREQCDSLIEMSLEWCDSCSTQVYTAGGNLLSFCCTAGLYVHSELSPPLAVRIRQKLDSLSTLDTTASAKNGNLLLRIAQQQPALGYLIAISLLLTKSFLVTNENAHVDDVRSLLRSVKLAQFCIQLCNRCLVVMGCEPWSSSDTELGASVQVLRGAASFREMGQSVLRAAMGRHSKPQKSDCTQDNIDPSLTPDEGDLEIIEITPEYQHILSWSWNTLRFSADILTRWAVVHTELEESISNNRIRAQCFRIGYLLLHILLHCRHRGTVEAVSASLQYYLTVSYRSNLLVMCEDVLSICWDVLCRVEFSVTRRAAGLWPAVRAALVAERMQKPRLQPSLLIGWIQNLILLAGPPKFCRSSAAASLFGRELTDPPQALALHLLRGIFSDACLQAHQLSICVPGHPTANSVVLALRLAVLPGFDFPSWTVSNAALQLHAVLVLRLTGTDCGRPKISTSEVFDTYVGLRDMFLDTLERACRDHEGLTSTTKLMPILTVLARLDPGEHENSTDARMRELLSYFLLNHRNYSVRQLAALAFLAFVRTTISSPMSELTQSNAVASLCNGLNEVSRVGPIRLLRLDSNVVGRSMETTVTSRFSVNAVHGQLCLLRAWFRQPTTASVLELKRNLFDWKVALIFLNGILIGPKHFGPEALLLVPQFCDVMFTVLNSTTKLSSDIQDGFTTLCYRLQSREFFRLSDTRFHSKSLLMFRRLMDRILGRSFPMSCSFSADPFDPGCLSRFLSVAEDEDVNTFLPSVIDFWHRAGPGLAYSHPSLCWRITQLCSIAVVHREKCSIVPLLSLPLSRALFDVQVAIGSRDLVHHAQALLCATIALDNSPIGMLPEWWVNGFSNCLQPTAPEPARLVAAQIPSLWIATFMEPVSSRCLHSGAEATAFRSIKRIIDAKSRCLILFLQTILFALFDECSTVRTRISSAVISIDGPLPANVPGCPSGAHLIAATHLLDHIVPTWLVTPRTRCKWFRSTYFKLMQRLNEQSVENLLMKQRSVLYEREVDNDFCEPRLLLELIAKQLNNEVVNPCSLTEWEWMYFCSGLQEMCHKDLLNQCSKGKDLFTVWKKQSIKNFVSSFHAVSPARFASTVGFDLLHNIRETLLNFSISPE
ncbi:hypothetical protein PHET_03593 [Paragonimus heterotremus]|uniref:DUF2428 domain-containing protein n=1 Tax=Paragonimus heterotremus TaxID=100268 RepID=A0A8J4TH99_9TREM|nr:hypothetical protein PHET_03593 [Paragonimus heterotremus]